MVLEQEWTAFFSIENKTTSPLLRQKLTKFLYVGGLRKIQSDKKVQYEKKTPLGTKFNRTIFKNNMLVPCVYKESNEALVDSSLFDSLEPTKVVERSFEYDKNGLRWSINQTSESVGLEVEMEANVDVNSFIAMIFQSNLVSVLQLVVDPPFSLQTFLSMEFDVSRKFVYETKKNVNWHSLKLDGTKHIGFLLSDRLIIPARNISKKFPSTVIRGGVAVVSVEDVCDRIFIIDIHHFVLDDSSKFGVSILDAIDIMENLRGNGVTTNVFVKHESDLCPDPTLKYDGRLEYTSSEITKIKPCNTIDLIYIYKKKISSITEYFQLADGVPLPDGWVIIEGFPLPSASFQVMEFKLNRIRQTLTFVGFRHDKMVPNTLSCFLSIVSCKDETEY